MGSMKVIAGEKSDTEPNPSPPGLPPWEKITGTQRANEGIAGVSIRLYVVEKNTTGPDAWYRGTISGDIPFPDPLDPAALGAAIERAVTAAATALPPPPGPNDIADAIADAVADVVGTLPALPTPADIAAAIATAVNSVQFPALPIQAMLLGDPAHPVTATLNAPDLRAMGLTASLGGTDKPLVATLNAPDLKAVGLHATVGGTDKAILATLNAPQLKEIGAEITARIGGTPESIKIDPVGVSLALSLDRLPKGKLAVRLPSLWFGLTLFSWKIIGFKMEVEGTVEAQATGDDS